MYWPFFQVPLGETQQNVAFPEAELSGTLLLTSYPVKASDFLCAEACRLPLFGVC
jgi:hypothetical protein